MKAGPSFMCGGAVAHSSAFVSVVERLSVFVDKVVSVLCGLFFGAMTLIVLLGVFFRYVLNAPLSWVEETARYLMIWGATSAISLGIKTGEHVGLTVLLDALKSRMLKALLHTAIALLVLSFFGVLFFYSLQMVKDAGTMQTQALGISMAFPYLAIPVSMAFALIQLVLDYILRMVRGAPKTQDLSMIDI
jgi:TRAP-type C4-dicarboxylate transport system permease small subunit